MPLAERGIEEREMSERLVLEGLSASGGGDVGSEGSLADSSDCADFFFC